MVFNREKDSVALYLKSFTVKKSPFWWHDNIKSYFVCMGIDGSGDRENLLSLNHQIYPHTEVGVKQECAEQGLIVYEPHNPKEFFTFSILCMASERDTLDFGGTFDTLANSTFLELVEYENFLENPVPSTAAMIIGSLTSTLSSFLKKNNDDEMARFSGSFDWMMQPPYLIGSSLSVSNSYITLDLNIVPITASS